MWLVVADLPVIAGYLALGAFSTPNVGLSASAQAQLGSKSQLAAPSGPSPRPAEPSSLRGKKPRAQMALGSSGHPNGSQISWTTTYGDCHCHQVLEVRDGREFFCFKALAWSVGSCGEVLELCRTQPSACPQLLQRPKAWGPRRKLRSTDPLLMTLCLAELCEPICWQNGTSNRHGLMVACY